MARIRKFFASIQTRLLGLFLINMLLTVAIVVYFNQQLRNQLTTEADNSLLVSAQQLADRIDEFNRSNRQVFNTGSRLPDLVDFLEANEEERNDSGLRSSALITLQSIGIEPWDEYYIISKAIIDQNGQNILDTAPANIGTDESQQVYFRAALSSGTLTISPIQYRPERSGIYFYYAVPFRKNGTPFPIIGILRIQVAIGTIQDIVFDRVRGQDLNVALFDENLVRVVDTQHEDLLFRSIVTFSNEELAVLRNEYALPPLPDNEVSIAIPSLADILSSTQDEYVVSGYTAPDTQVEERLAIVKLKTVPWYLVVSQPTDQYYEPVQQQSRGLLILAITLTFIALLSSYLISRRVTKPIRVLTAVANQVAEGSLHMKAPITSSDEVGILAKTFNLMTTELEIAHATLEARVEERTRELLETNKELMHEITERKRYEKQALDLALEHERIRLLSEFITKASHEFRTPLSIINTNSYIVKKLVPPEKQRYLNIIEEQSQYINGLINRMVLMARLDSGISSRLKYLLIDEFIRTLIRNKANAFEEKKTQTHLDLQAANLWVYADPELLTVAIQNILDNALNNSEAALEISVRTYASDDMVSIIIEDNGTGIPEDLQTRVLERFFRVDEAHSTRGFGLGLPIAKRIFENFGGSLELKSEVGKGTTIIMKLGIRTKNQI